MNIKYIFRSEQNTTNAVLNPTIFASQNGGLFPGADKETFSRNLQLIESRIDAIQKELSYWDLYKIVSKVTSPAELDSIYNDLIVGQSLVIECESFVDNSGQDLHRGDVIVKLSSGEAALIQAVNTGYYQPVVESVLPGVIKISYDYKTNNPINHLDFDVAEGEAPQSFIYGIYDNFETTYLFDKYVYNSVEIQPLVKLFSKNDETGELEEIIMNEMKVETNPSNSDGWKVSVPDKPSYLNFIQVK